MILAQMDYDSPWITISLFTFLAVVVYFMPTIIAAARRHHKKRQITLLNVFAGWTIAGWLASLIWSLTPVETVHQKIRKKRSNNL